MPIVPATAADLPAVQKLLAECQLPFEDLTPVHLESFLIAREAGTVCASGGLEIRGSAALLRSLAVAESARNQQLGQTLIGELESMAVQRRVDRLFLLTDTATDYFTRRGYTTITREAAPQPIRETREFSELCPASSTCMTRTLNRP